MGQTVNWACYTSRDARGTHKKRCTRHHCVPRARAAPTSYRLTGYRLNLRLQVNRNRVVSLPKAESDSIENVNTQLLTLWGTSLTISLRQEVEGVREKQEGAEQIVGRLFVARTIGSTSSSRRSFACVPDVSDRPISSPLPECIRIGQVFATGYPGFLRGRESSPVR